MKKFLAMLLLCAFTLGGIGCSGDKKDEKKDTKKEDKKDPPVDKKDDKKP